MCANTDTLCLRTHTRHMRYPRAHMCVYADTYVSTCRQHACVHIQTHSVYTHRRRHRHVRMHKHARARAQNTPACTFAPTPVHVRTWACACTQRNVYAHTSICMCTPLCAHTHTHTHHVACTQQIAHADIHECAHTQQTVRAYKHVWMRTPSQGIRTHTCVCTFRHEHARTYTSMHKGMREKGGAGRTIMAELGGTCHVGGRLARNS